MSAEILTVLIGCKQFFSSAVLVWPAH